MRPDRNTGVGHHFSTGSEIWMHRLALILVAVRNIILASLAAGLIVGALHLWLFAPHGFWPDLADNVLARIRSTLYMTAAPMNYNRDGAVLQLSVDQVVALTDPVWGRAGPIVRKFLILACTVAIIVAMLIGTYWYEFGRAAMKDTQMRGATLATGPELKRLLEKADDASPYQLAGVPMRKKSETLHTIITGAQGTGKSQQFFALMKQVRARGKRMIVYDPSGEFTAAFYRPGVDIIMNPFDDRAPNWNIWQEIEEEYHFDNMASGLIPNPTEADPFWAMAGREVFRDVVQVLQRENRMTNKNLYSSVALNNLDGIYQLLRNTAGASYVDPITERTGMSLKMTVQNQLSSFRYLRDDGPHFSIRRWIQQESESWMFISTREEMREAIKPVLSLWVDIAVKAVLGLDPIHRERLWFALDELPTLQKLDILKQALTGTRKYGLCMVLGVQDFSQIYEVYGVHLATTIISGCQTKLLLRVTDGEAAEKLAELIGEGEIEEKDESVSFGLNSQRDGVNIAKRRQLRDLVLSSEIRRLPDMTGYLVVPGDYPTARVSYKYVPTPKVAPAFVKRRPFGELFSGGGAPAPDGPTPSSPSPGGPAAPEDWTTKPEILAAPVEYIHPATGEVVSTGRSAWQFTRI
ncbi:type VI secretion protein [Burkholderia ubonensis]|nr:type VI secretion protein [Burkholderia ubonensis]